MTDNDLDPLSLFAMAELNQLRTQALDLFDRCLAENNLGPIVAFVERYIQEDPPHLPLLREFSDGLHQRLLSLRAYQFDVRQRVLQTFTDDYGVDIGPMLPASAYHLMNVKQVLDYARQRGRDISDDDLLILGKLLDASVKTASRLQSQIEMVEQLQRLVQDWLNALNATVGRRYWSEDETNGLIQ